MDFMHTVVNLFCILHAQSHHYLLIREYRRLLLLTPQTPALGNLVTIHQIPAFLLHVRSLSPSCVARAHRAGLRWSFLAREYPPVLFVVCLSSGVASLAISSDSHTLRFSHNHRRVFNLCRSKTAILVVYQMLHSWFLTTLKRTNSHPPQRHGNTTATQWFLCLMSFDAILDVPKRDSVAL